VSEKFGKTHLRTKLAQQSVALVQLEKIRESGDNAELVKFVDTHFSKPEEAGERVLLSSLQVLSDRVPEAALSVVDSHGTKVPLLFDRLPHIVEQWAGRDLNAPGEWLNRSRESGIYDRTAAAYVRAIKTEDFPAAKRWADSIQSPELKAETLKVIPPLPPL
jgi:hypothetical protein